LLDISDSSGEYTYTYDALNRMLSETSTAMAGRPAFVLTYAYDAVGNLLSVSDSLGGSTAHSYDELNRRTQTTLSGTGLPDVRTDFSYDAVGNFDTIQRYADLAGAVPVASTAYTYDAVNQLVALTHQRNTQILADYTWTFDAAGRITQMTSPDGTADYTLDATDQLTVADYDTQTDEAYAYDATGNRTGGSEVIGDGNRLLSDSAFNYQYDDEGNLTRRTDKVTGDYQQFSWDYRNRLVKVVDYAADNTAQRQVEYVYDAFNNRIAKLVDSNADNQAESAQYFVVDGDQVVMEFQDDDGAGQNAPVLASRFVYGPMIDQAMARVNVSTGDVVWALADHEGSVRDLLTFDGTAVDLVGHIQYDSFGNILDGAASATAFGAAYTGREWDADIGLYYYRARYYDPSTGRFASEDPLGFAAGDTNLYRYVGNLPVNSTDPSGLCARNLGLGGISDRIDNLLKGIGNPYYTADVRTKLGLELAAELRKLGMNKYDIEDTLAPMFKALSKLVNAQGAAANYANPVYDRAQILAGSLSILANKLTFGASDYAGATNSSEWRGNTFVGARASGDAAAFAFSLLPGVGAAKAGSIAEMVVNGSRGAQAFLAGRSLGTGAGQMYEGDYWEGTVSLAEGGMQAFGAFGGMRSPAGKAAAPNELEDLNLTDAGGRQHILEGDASGGGHGAGRGVSGKSEFPADWSDQRVLNEVSDIATDPKLTWTPPDSRGYITTTKTVNGVNIKVVYDTRNARIVTGYPRNMPRNP